VNITRQDGFTPLHCAAQRGYREIVQCLCESGADVKVITNKGASPCAWQRNSDIVKLFRF